MNRDYCCHGGCSQGREACPLIEARKRGFVAPRPPQESSPKEEIQTGGLLKFGLIALLALIFACILSSAAGVRLDYPFN